MIVDAPQHGTLTLNGNGFFVYTHNGLTSSNDSFTYVANDGINGSNLATVNLTVNPLSDDNVQIVRWHGDYYQHLWITGIPGGSPREIRENRWLRGGPAAGEQKSQQDLDLDGDGQFDDSRVYFDFSLEDELNPLDTNPRENGIIYHTELPSARFYGGLSADFLNYETDRIQQAFIENDGAGGELDDVGYPSPYLGPEFQGLSDFIELARGDDGRPRKDHVGPQEDFAINLYRPDLPHPLDESDDPSDNLVTFSAAFIWKKEDFLAGGATSTVSLDSESSFSFESTRWWDTTNEARWILQGEDGQLYISQFTLPGELDRHGATNEFADPLSSNWAVYAPAVDDLDFDDTSAVWIDPVANNLFNDIQSVGIYIANDTPSGDLTRFSLDEIQFNAVLTPTSAVAAATSSESTEVSAAVSSEMIGVLDYAFSSDENGAGEVLADAPFAAAVEQSSAASADSFTQAASEDFFAAESFDEASLDSLEVDDVDLYDVDDAFAELV